MAGLPRPYARNERASGAKLAAGKLWVGRELDEIVSRAPRHQPHYIGILMEYLLQEKGPASSLTLADRAVYGAPGPHDRSPADARRTGGDLQWDGLRHGHPMLPPRR
jgi:hypothetical protein